ncbi:MAG: hypothetical protein GYB37_14490 [Algicola sp.]|nr:hypothetical protein [Algicola sp.]
MLERLKNIELFKQKYYAVIGLRIGQQVVYDILLLEKEKENLSISKSFSTNNFGDIKREVSIKTPIILNFSGTGIISKKVNREGNYMKEVLFNVKKEDFYNYTVHQSTSNYVSISRKESIEYHFEQFKKEKYNIVDYSIGPFVALLCVDFLKNETLLLENEELIFSNGNLTDYRKSSKDIEAVNYKIGSDLISGSEVILLSSMLNYLYPVEDIDYEKGFLSEGLKEYRFKKTFDYLAVGGLVAFLAALLGSYLLLRYFNKEYVEYEQQLYHFNDSFSQIKQMEKELANKQFLAENTGVFNKKFLSFYINELMESIPEGILISKLHVNPLEESVKANEPISLQPNIIRVEGEASNSFYVNQWVKNIKKAQWVDKVEIMGLNRVDKHTELFLLRIKID